MSRDRNNCRVWRHPSELPDERLREECALEFTRRSGPGGQHRNKVETAARLEHRPTGVRAEASERRSQADNLRAALRRLRVQLALDVRSPWQQPSVLWQSRCRQKRLAVGVRHADFSALLAEALDALASCDWQPALAAERLGCSSSQLVRLLRHDHRALGQLNQQRANRGLGPLH
jgi:hypothetical protein